MGQRKAYEGKYTVNSFQYPCRRWVCLHAQRLDRSIDDFCADNHNYFQFKLKGKRRSAGSGASLRQYIAEVVDVPVVQLHRCCSWRDGMSFWVVYTGTRPGVAPAIRAGKGWGDARSLLPGVLPPN